MSFDKVLLVSGLLFGIASINAEASLVDRGGGLLYDTVLKVTWLQDANYAKTSGYSGAGVDFSSGKMRWDAAQTWAANLVYHDSIRNVNYSDWRLPSLTDTNAPGCDFAVVGTDCGYNSDTANSELADMYFVNLGLKSLISPTGSAQTDYGIFGNGTVIGQNDVGLVKNLQSSLYWFGTEFAGSAWFFNTLDGTQDLTGKSAPLSVWAVRDGDVTVVPVPAAGWFLATGIIGLIAGRRNSLLKNKNC